MSLRRMTFWDKSLSVRVSTADPNVRASATGKSGGRLKMPVKFAKSNALTPGEPLSAGIKVSKDSAPRLTVAA